MLGPSWTTLNGLEDTRETTIVEKILDVNVENLVFFPSSEKFGLHSVDFNDPDRPRTPKESSKYLKSLVLANGFVESDGPCSNGPD